MANFTKLHGYFFTCLVFAVNSAVLNGNWESWAAASFVICSLIDFDGKLRQGE